MQNFDQAQRLREAVVFKKNIDRQDKPNISSTRVICISSGKGGVGKSNFTINLAIALQSQGKKVIVIDADLGLANVEILLGIMPKFTLLDVISKNTSIKDVITRGPMEIGIISGGSGIQSMAELSLYDMNKLLNEINALKDMADFILIDTGAGISKSVTAFIEASEELIVITTCEPPAIADAYALIKIMSGIDKQKKISLVANRAEDTKEAENVFMKLSSVSKKFLDMNIDYLGEILDDDNVTKSVKKQVPFYMNNPKSKASQGIQNISERLLDMPVSQKGFNSFMKKLKGLFAGGGA